LRPDIAFSVWPQTQIACVCVCPGPKTPVEMFVYLRIAYSLKRLELGPVNHLPCGNNFRGALNYIYNVRSNFSQHAHLLAIDAP